MKWGGIIASAMMGGVAGAGQGMATAAKMEADEQIERRKQEMLAKREEQLAKLRHEQEKPFKERAIAVDEARATESARHNKAMEDQRVKEVEQQGRHQTATLAEHAKDRESRERLARQNAKNIQTLEDGTLATYNPETNTMEAIRDPGTGTPLKGQKDLSLADKTKVSILSAEGTKIMELRAKSFDEEEKAKYDKLLAENRRRLYGVLGMDAGSAAQAPGAATGGGKPWERFKAPGAR